MVLQRGLGLIKNDKSKEWGLPVLPSLVINHCDWVWSHLRDRLLGMSVRVSLERFS